MSTLNGKVAIITGASGGIGFATATRLADEGAKVMAVDLEETALKELYEPLGDGFAWHACDVSKEGSAAAYVGATVERFGGVDILYANAGIEGKVAPIAQTKAADFDRVISVNVRGVFLGIRAVIDPMKERGGGSIIVTSSVAGLIAVAGISPYITSKHAVLGLMKTAAVELGPLGIRVNSVNPGPIENRMMRSLEKQVNPSAAEAVKKAFEAQVPLGRYGLNEEIAAVVRFLASDEASYCNGATFVADGGYVTQ